MVSHENQPDKTEDTPGRIPSNRRLNTSCRKQQKPQQATDASTMDFTQRSPEEALSIGDVAPCASPPAMRSDRLPDILPHAVVGLGRFGNIHARKLIGLPGFQLRAMVDPCATPPQQETSLSPVPFLRGVAELPFDIASATIASSDATHAEVALELIARGCHLLVEKPICLAPADGMRMLQAAKQQGVTLCTGHVERFNPLFHPLRRAEILAFATEQRGRPAPMLHFRRRSCRQAAAMDSVLDLMVHDLDLMAWLCAVPRHAPLELIDRRVSATSVRVHVQLDGLEAVFESGFGATVPEAVIQMETGHGPLTLDLRDAHASQPKGSDPLCQQYAAFRQAIRGEPTCIATGHDGLAAVVRACRILQA